MARFGLLGAAVLLASCSNDLLTAIQDDVERATAPQVPTIEVSRGATPYVDGSTYAFGSQPTGSDTDITFSIKNAGTGTLLLGTPTVVPSNETDGFSVQTLSGTSVASGASVNLVLRFAPANGSDYSAVVTIPSNAQNDDSVVFNLTGTGVAPDTTPPTGSVFINSNATYTQSANVTLTLSATDTGGGTVTHMRVSNNLVFPDTWLAYATSMAWSLTAGDGTNTVYVQFRDSSGNISTGTISDSIILDTVNPTISSRTPSSGASAQARNVATVVNFSESMDQSTFTTSTVYLRIKGGATVSTNMTKAAGSVTLTPVSNLYYGYDYTIVVTSGVKDLSGRAITNPGSTNFTVDRDYWEGANGNDLPNDARDLSGNNNYYWYGSLPWTDFVPDTQEETDSFNLPTGVHTPLAVLDGYDYYVIEVPDSDAYFLRIRVLFTTDTANGTIVDSSGTETLMMYVNHNSHGMGSPYTIHADSRYDRDYEYDISDPDWGGPGTYVIGVYAGNSGDYASRRTYNLRWYMEPGI